MPSEAGSRSIFETLFGCCLGHRGQSSISASRNDDHRGASSSNGREDERTPLLGPKGRQNDGNAEAGTSGQGRRSSIDRSLDKRAISRKRQADAARLRAIRDQANDAFFYIDNSQILPSSSSSRPMNMSGSKRDTKRDASLHHQGLVAESDNAERLYKAALTTAALQDAENLALSPQGEAPLSLVRQMKVTIREATKEKPLGQEATTAPAQRRPSSSPVDAHAKMGLDVSDDQNIDENQQPISKYPSLHSLRTLRLGPRRSFGSLDSMGSENALPRDVLGGEDDAEEWSRGRTRSKRGLAWTDVGQSNEVKQDSKSHLQESFTEHKEPPQEVSAAAQALSEEVPNALRLSSKQSDTARDVQSRLKASSSIAELWESTQDS